MNKIVELLESAQTAIDNIKDELIESEKNKKTPVLLTKKDMLTLISSIEFQYMIRNEEMKSHYPDIILRDKLQKHIEELKLFFNNK